MVQRQSGTLSRRLVQLVGLLSFIALLGLLGAVVLGLLSTLQGVQNQLGDAGTMAVRAFDQFLGSVKSDLLATSDALAETDEVELILQRTLERQFAIFELVLVDPQGQILAQRRRVGTGDAVVLVEQPWLETLQTGEVYVSAVNFEEFGVPFADMAVAVSDDAGNLEATLLAKVDLSALWNTAIGIRVGQTGYVYIADENGYVLAYRDMRLLQSGIALDNLVGLSPQVIVDSGFRVYTGISDETVVATGVSLDTVPWFAIVEQPISEAFRPFVVRSGVLLIALLLVGVLVYSIVRFTRRRIVSPLLSLREGVDTLGKNLDHRIDIQTQDELGNLATAFNSMATQLQELVGTLEQRVRERTQVLAYRSIQLETAAQVSEAAGRLIDPDELERQVVGLIRQRFDYYYVGLFLVDDSGEWTGEPGQWAVLRAGTGSAGRAMLERRHKLKIGGASMIGWCTAHGQARIALDVGDEAIHTVTFELPNTRSEMALPLVARGGKIIGALTVQSEREAAFSEEDVSILQTMAAQVANAIQNARLFEQTQAALAEMETLYNTSRRITSAGSLQEMVTAFAEGLPVPGVDRAILWDVERDIAGEVKTLIVSANWHSGKGTPPLPHRTRFPVAQYAPAPLLLTTEPIFVDDMKLDDRLDAMTRAAFQRQNVRAIALLPLRVGGRQLGTLMLLGEESYRFSEREIRLYRLLMGQMAVAIENHRLFEQAQIALTETQTLYEASRQLGTTLDERDVLRNVLSQIVGVGADRVTIGFYEGAPGEPPEWFNVAAVYQPELGHQITVGRILPLSALPAVQYAYEHALDGPTVMNDVVSNPPAEAPLRTDFVERGVQAFVSIPMLWQGNPFAALTVEREQQTYFTEFEINLYQAIAGQATVAIQNARLFRQAETRAARLQAAAEVSRVASSILEPDELMQQAVDLLQRRFNLYYVGLFLVEETQRWAVLRAGTGEAGRIQVEQNYRIEVGGDSMIGQCVAQAKARISQDVGGEVLRYVNPLLPETRSEMALPLISRGHVIGALTIQDSREAAFSEEDISALQTMADQLASAIEGARLFEQTQQALAEVEATYQRYLKREWQTYLRRPSAAKSQGFHDGPDGTMPLSALRPLAAGSASDEDQDHRQLAVSIKLRGQTIGTIDLYHAKDREWSEDEQALAESMAEQLALAIENTRLFEQTQYRAQREQLIRQITDRIRGTVDLDTILQTAVMELGKVLGTSHAAIRLGTETELASPPALPGQARGSN